ncbi:MAG: nicotinate-nucleotide adenylyltransferase [Thermodesulfobacteriota bacterium]|nr:nicotinate-nucleotide adenylyltransferase [Thermodesulfobacteriota bacterium]
MRIGLFGGTYNPIHLGHLRAAVEVKQGFSLNEIYFIPCAIPPHKQSEHVAGPKERYEMTRMATLNTPGFVASDVELKRSGPSYTIDTIIHFKSALAKDSELYFILGLDAFLEIDTWKSYMNLFPLIPFIILTRPYSGHTDPDLRQQQVEDFIHSKISTGYKFNASQSGFFHKELKPVFLFDVTPLEISSSAIRSHIKEGRSIRFLVPDQTIDFIKTNGLYR